MRHNKKVNNRLSDQSLWGNNPLRQQNTVNNCAEQRESRTIRDQHRSNRSPTLHISNLLKEALNMKKINIRIHTDSSSGKSMATRIGSAKKAKHIELKHLFIQLLVAHDLVRVVKICQDQHRQQPGRHLHQVRCNRDAFASHR